MAVKTALAAALEGVETTDITVKGITKTTAAAGRRRLAVDGIAVDYVIALAEAAAAAAKTASASMTVPAGARPSWCRVVPCR